MSIDRGLLALVCGAVVALSACGGTSKSSSQASSTPQAMAKASESEFYAEESSKGRTYVFGTEKAHEKFRASGEVPAVAKTYIGAGPSGESVVLEADGKNPALQDRLRAEFNRRHRTTLP